jgi:hypothetical protein
MHVRAGLARWLPSGAGLVVFGRQGDRGAGYVIDFPSGVPHSIAGAAALQNPSEAVVAPDGRAAAVYDSATGQLWVVPFDRSTAMVVRGSKQYDRPVRWLDAETLYVRGSNAVPAVVEIINVAAGERRLWKTLAPADRAGQETMYGLAISRDGSTYAYDIYQELTDLFLVDGLK